MFSNLWFIIQPPDGKKALAKRLRITNLMKVKKLEENLIACTEQYDVSSPT
jgi:hypothetical protein